VGTEWGQRHQIKKNGANLELANSTILFGTPGAIRTRGTRIRNPLLYPTELRGHPMDQMKGLSRLACFFRGVNGHERWTVFKPASPWLGVFSLALFSLPIFPIRTFDIKSQER
jgi:hypothetical protein